MRRLTLPIVVHALLVVGCEGELSVPVADPVADAGFDQVRHFGRPDDVEITLDGRASCDPMGDAITTVQWTIVSAPGEVPEVTVDGLTGRFLASEPGEYVVSLRVETSDRTSERDYMAVTVVDGTGDDILVAPPSTDACGNPID